MKLIILLFIGLNFGLIQDKIPQGKFEYELYFSESDGRMPNTSVDVIIKGNQIKVLKNEKTKLTGGDIIIEGELIKHNSGIWIISKNDSDKHSIEFGGCTDGPTPIDFKKMIIEWC